MSVADLNSQIAELDRKFQQDGAITMEVWQDKRKDLVARRDWISTGLESRGSFLVGMNSAGIQRQIDRLRLSERAEALALYDESIKAGLSGQSARSMRLLGELDMKLNPDREFEHVPPPQIERPAPAPVAAKQKKPYEMKAVERSELDAFEQKFTDALDAGDADAMFAVLKDKRYIELTLQEALAEESKHSTLLNLCYLQARMKQAMALLQINRVSRLALEKRIADLEARPTMEYCGVWSDGESYVEGKMVTWGGSMWACRQPTKSRPGTDDTWQLAVKRGTNGKDA